jgi:hypothetical protein
MRSDVSDSSSDDAGGMFQGTPPAPAGYLASLRGDGPPRLPIQPAASPVVAARWNAPGEPNPLLEAAARARQGARPAPDQGVTPQRNNRFFNVLDARLGDLADSLALPRNYLRGLAAHESGYYDDHNLGLANPLGLTKAGGPNLAFPSVDDAIAYWRQLYGGQVRGASSPEDFAQRLLGRRDGAKVSGWNQYNDEDKRWPQKVVNTINSIGRRREKWKDEQNFDR